MILRMLFLAAFCAAALLVFGCLQWIRGWVRSHPELRRAYAESRGPWWMRSWDLGVRTLTAQFPDTAFSRLRKRIDLDLRRLGRASEPEAERFLARSILEGAGIAVTCGWLGFATAGEAMPLLVLGVWGLYALGVRPHWLRSRAEQRMAQIRKRLPYAIDLAALVLGAGGTLQEGLEMIGQQENSPLGEEISIALAEIRNGTPQYRALEAMARRLRLEDLEALVVAINRGEATGAPMAKSLETQAESFRFRSLQRAEKLAVEAPVKMMFPNLLIMLSVLLVVLGPVLVQLARDGLL